MFFVDLKFFDNTPTKPGKYKYRRCRADNCIQFKIEVLNALLFKKPDISSVNLCL